MKLSLVQWVGGKGQQLSDLLPLVPRSHCYVEPYGGGASLLLNRRPCPVEVYNDLNGEVVNLFRVARDPEKFQRLEALLECTLFSKDEFREALRILYGGEEYDDISRAWATYTVQNMGISGKHHRTEGNWSRSLQDSKNTERWWKRFDKLAYIHERLRHVQIDSQDALDCMRYWDGHDTTFYVDPPYVLSTRDQEYYEVEADDDQHRAMTEVLLGLQGAVVLSGYDHPIYEPLSEAGWQVDQYGASAIMRVGTDTKPRRVEVVWRNQRAMELSGQQSLF